MSVFMKRNRFLLGAYIELDYIESIGTQYINTNFLPNQNTRVIIDADVTKSSSGTTYIFGLDEWVEGQYFHIRISATATTFYSDYGNNLKNTTVSPNGRTIFDKNKNVCTINGVTIENTMSDFQCTAPLKLFAGSTSTGIHTANTKGKIYSCQIYDNGVIVRDYIPVMLRKTKEVGLWDKVNNVFYGNPGTGEFIGVKNNMPVNGKLLEYIESSGTQDNEKQYIDTGFAPNQDTKIIIDIQGVGTDTDGRGYYGVDNPPSSRFWFGKATATSWDMRCYYGTQYEIVDTWDISEYQKRRRIVQDKNVFTLDGQNYTFTYQEFQLSYNMYIFCVNSSGDASNHCSFRLFSCQIYDNDVIIRDYIPYQTPNGDVGLWDKVHCKFYGNAGTDVFIAGEEIA